ncbi:transposase [Streptomyces sp. NPDC091212]|uniref:MmyB family transcriptional regulator n=1 Tax=Streptomyces sp. NPDC091212 TaxID=3155191 RepID=UPI00344058E4
MVVKNYPPEFKADTVALYESRPDATIRSAAADLGINPETLRNWVRAAGIGELSLASPLFRALWNRHVVGAQRGASIRFDHPKVDEVWLNREMLAISGADGPHLVVLHARSGSADADKLMLLASSALAPGRAGRGGDGCLLGSPPCDETA